MEHHGRVVSPREKPFLRDGTWNYTWQHGRQLASMSNSTTTWIFSYNPDGLRTQKTNGTKTYSYVYNGSSLSQMTVGKDTLRFFYDASGLPVSVEYNGTAYFYATNVQGDIVAILDATGVAVVEYTYDAWGRHLAASGSALLTIGAIGVGTYITFAKPQTIEKKEQKKIQIYGNPPPVKSMLIYRYGGTNPGNLTPKEKDKYSGLSFSTTPRPGAAVTTIDAINSTGVLIAVRDGLTHVSVIPLNGTVQDWINAGTDSIWTRALQSVVIKWDGEN